MLVQTKTRGSRSGLAASKPKWKPPSEAQGKRGAEQPRRAPTGHSSSDQISATPTHTQLPPSFPFETRSRRGPTTPPLPSLLPSSRRSRCCLWSSPSPRSPPLPSPLRRPRRAQCPPPIFPSPVEREVRREKGKKGSSSLELSCAWIRRAPGSRRRRGLLDRSAAARPGGGAGANTTGGSAAFLGEAACRRFFARPLDAPCCRRDGWASQETRHGFSNCGLQSAPAARRACPNAGLNEAWLAVEPMVGAARCGIPSSVWVLLLFLSSLLLPAASADFSHCGGCDDADDAGLWSNDNILQCQKVSDFLIAAAYFSIPLELLYFATCSDLFPLKWIVLQFGAFIVLCGLTHLITVFTYEPQPHLFHLVLALTVAKFLTALVSFATAITLLTLIPQLLRVKVRENFLMNKARELDREVGMMKRKEEASWHVRMLTQEIRKSLDRHTILYTTMVELSKTLELQNCAVWMPNEGRSKMILTHQLRERDIMDPQNRSIPIHDPDVLEIKATKDAIVLAPESALGVASRSKLEAGPVAAIRMPMLSVSNFKGGTPEVMETSYAILVLVLPNDGSLGWGRRELEIVEVVADQVAVALSHAALLEESQLMREKLAEQHRDLLRAKHEAMRAGEARNSFQSAMYDGMRRPMHSILGLVSMMQQESMNPEQRLVMDAIAKTSSVASTLMNDVMQTSTMNHEHLSLVRRPFNLHSLIKEAVGVVRCLAGCKGVEFEFQVDSSLPERIVGDEKRVFHIVLHMVGSLMNRCNAGCISLYVNSHNEVEERHNQDWMLRRANFSGGYVCVKFEIRIRKSKDYLLSSSSSQISLGSKLNNSEMGLSFNMCKKIVQMMNGNIWSVSDSKSIGETIMLVLQFQLQPVTPVSGASSDLYRSSIPNFKGLRVLLADSDDTNRAVTHRLLEKLGCRVLSVASGMQCMNSFAAESSFQLVILDLAMQTMDGFELALAIRKFSSNSWLPLIVALAARTDDNVRDRCQRSGINGLIQKPVTLAALGDELYRVLQNN